MKLFPLLMLLAAFLGSGCATSRPTHVPRGYRLVVNQAFTSAASLDRFAFSDPEAWKHTGSGTNAALELVRQSNYKPAVRSPLNIALLRDLQVRDFVLDVDLLQTGREYGHRDMCLYFGFQEPARFYYAHIATAADNHAHNVFRVQDAPRTKFADVTTRGVAWGLDVWRHVRIERNSQTGLVRVFFEDMTRPIMVAHDKTFDWGWVGFGSFDDTGRIDNIRLWAPETRTTPGANPFKP